MSDAEDDLDARPSGILGRIGEFVRSWGPAVFAVLFIRTFVFEPFRIPSGSMVPTLLIGDHVAVSKYSYGIWVPATLVEIPFLDFFWVVPRYQIADFGGPERGDIVVFRYPKDESVNYIKRVVGLPGERIRVEDNKIFINGVEMTREYQEKYQFTNASCGEPTPTNRYIEDLEGLEHEILTRTGMGGQLANRAEVEIPQGHVFAMGDNRDFSEDSRRWGMVRDDQIKGKAHVVWLSWNGCQGTVGSIRLERFFRNLYTL